MSLQQTGEQCAEYMARISEMFKRPNEVTLIVRRPGYPNQDFMLTNDSFQELKALLDRRTPPSTGDE